MAEGGADVAVGGGSVTAGEAVGVGVGRDVGGGVAAGPRLETGVGIARAAASTVAVGLAGSTAPPQPVAASAPAISIRSQSKLIRMAGIIKVLKRKYR